MIKGRCERSAVGASDQRYVGASTQRYSLKGVCVNSSTSHAPLS